VKVFLSGVAATKNVVQ